MLNQLDEVVVGAGAAAATAVVATASWFAKLMPWRRRVDKELAEIRVKLVRLEDVAADVKNIRENRLPHLHTETQETGRKVARILGILEGEDRQRSKAD